MNLDRAVKIKSQLRSEITAVWREGIEKRKTADEIRELFRRRCFARFDTIDVPNWLREWACTYCHAMEDITRATLVVFSYEYDGKRYAIDDEEYRKIDPRLIDTKTGRFVWRADLSTFYAFGKLPDLTP